MPLRQTKCDASAEKRVCRNCRGGMPVSLRHRPCAPMLMLVRLGHVLAMHTDREFNAPPALPAHPAAALRGDLE